MISIQFKSHSNLFFLVHQFPFRLTSANDPSSSQQTPPLSQPPPPSPSQIITKPTQTTKSAELPKIQLQRFEMDTRKRGKSSNQMSKRPISSSRQVSLAPPPPPPILLPPPPTTPTVPQPEPIKNLPLSIYDFNGAPEYYHHIASFVDGTALHILCIHTVDFHQNTPNVIEDVFNGKFDVSSSDLIQQLFQILQILTEKATKTRAIMILPMANCIDLFDEKSPQDKYDFFSQ